jgi:FkbM family methyltransferase
MNLRSINYHIGNLMRRRGYAVVREHRQPLCTLNVLLLAIRLLQSRRQSLSIVQIGAFDGDSNDPLKEVVRDPGSKVVLVEPQPGPCELLVSRYAHHPWVHIENSAVGSEDGTIAMFLPEGDCSSQLASIDERHMRNMGAGETRSITVNSISVATLMRKYRLETVDVLQIDTEGYDFKILSQFLDAGIEPAVINFESFHLSKDERNGSRRMLTERGYGFLDYGAVGSNMDTLAVKHELLSMAIMPT